MINFALVKSCNSSLVIRSSKLNSSIVKFTYFTKA